MLFWQEMTRSCFVPCPFGSVVLKFPHLQLALYRKSDMRTLHQTLNVICTKTEMTELTRIWGYTQDLNVVV